MGTTGAEQPPGPHATGDELTFEVRDRPENVSVARRTIGQFLGQYGVPATMVDEMQLVASELVTNAMLHGRAGPIGVGVQVHPAVDVTLNVRNAGPVSAIPPVAAWRPPNGLVASGRGLGIVRTLTDDVEVHGDDEHAEVTCRRRWVIQEDAR